MKHCVKNIILVAAMPLVCFCAKNDEFTQSGNGEIVKISAGLPETKISLTPGTDPALALAWENGDQIVVEGTSSSTFTLSEIIDAHKATFEGEAVPGSEFAVYYPSKDILTRSYEGQVQDGNASTNHLDYNAMVEGLPSYESFTFNKVNGAIKLVVKVPSSVTEVSAISITSQTSDGESQDVFYKTNDAEGEKTATLSLGFSEGTAPAEGVLTAYAMVSWNAVELAVNSRLAIKLTVPDRQCSYQKTIKVTTATTVAGGQTFIIDLSDANELEHVISGSGTESDPYLLYDCEDLLCIRPILEKNVGEYQYFKLMNDIDMSPIENWLPLNDGNIKDSNNKEFAGRIHFDGNNKKLSNLKSVNKAYTSFFGVFIGSVKNLTFENPVIYANSSACAVIGGFIGQTNNLGKVENVTINGADVSYTTGSAVAAIAGATIATAEISGVTVANSKLTYNAKDSNNESGILFGKQNNALYTINISDCHAINNTVTYTRAPKCCGGVIGNLTAGAISKCSIIGNINAGCNNIGGIVGNMSAGKISECWYSGNLTVKDNSGGIAGAQSSTDATSDVIIENCYTTGTITNNGSQKCGGIAGECCKNSKIRNCFSTMNISGSGRVFGNIAGRFNNNGWNGNSDTDLNMEVTNSIAAGSINSTAINTSFGSSGALLGVAPCKIAHYTNCWRIYGYSFECAYKGTATLIDQGYTVTSFTVGTYAGGVGGSNWYPYHASEATATALQTAYSGWTTSKTDAQITVSDIASATNHSDPNAWKSDIWDLSGNYPTLKSNPEPTE